MSQGQHFRLTDDETMLFYDALNQLGMNKTQLIKKAIFSYIKRSTKVTGELKQVVFKMEAYKKIRKDNHSMFAVKNCVQTVWQLGMTSLLVSGKLNFPMLKQTIQNTLDLVKTMTLEEQTNLKEDVENLEKMLNPTYLSSKFKTMERLDFIKKDKQ